MMVAEFLQNTNALFLPFWHVHHTTGALWLLVTQAWMNITCILNLLPGKTLIKEYLNVWHLLLYTLQLLDDGHRLTYARLFLVHVKTKSKELIGRASPQKRHAVTMEH